MWGMVYLMFQAPILTEINFIKFKVILLTLF